MNRADLRDTGFGNPQAAQLIVRRLRMRAALQDARASIEGLLDCLDQGLQSDRDAHSTLFDEGGGLVSGAAERVERNRPINSIRGNNVREKELLEGTKVVLQFLDTVGVGLRHGLFSSSYAVKGNPSAVGAHRLCGDAK